jgi:hypothetical protein
MTLPTPETILPLVRILPIWHEALTYCANETIERNLPGCISFDQRADELQYHLKLTDMDRQLFDVLAGSEEIWIIVKAGVES